MATIFSMIIAHLYGDTLCMIIWSKLLGRKYSKQFTVFVTFALCLVRLALKIYMFLNEGFHTASITSSLGYITYIFYILLLFRSSKAKRLAIMTLTSMIMIIMDVVGTSFWIAVTGQFDFMQLESTYTVSYVIVGNAFISVGLLIMYWCLTKIEKIRWETDWYRWFSLLLPISQWFLVLNLGEKFLAEGIKIPEIAVAGIILGIIADGYMFILFRSSNKHKRSEKELRYMNHQYQLEQVRYEQLKEQEEETLKLRHDFQNYILLTKNMK